MDTRTELRDFISRELAGGLVEGGVGDDADLLAEGIVDSMGVLRILEFIETKWGLEVPVEDATLVNFKSVSTIAGYVERRR